MSGNPFLPLADRLYTAADNLRTALRDDKGDFTEHERHRMRLIMRGSEDLARDLRDAGNEWEENNRG